MKNQKQKIYILLSVGITLFLTVVSVIVLSFFNSQASKTYALEEFLIGNINTQSAEIFWKGFSKDSNFKLLYKQERSTGIFRELAPTNIYSDTLYPKGFLYNIKLQSLEPGEKYIVELWHDDIRLTESTFTTLPIEDELHAPKPVSGESFVFDWMKISDSSNTYIVRTDENGSWVMDRNLLEDNYAVEIFSSSLVKEGNPISSYITNTVHASELANCDEITYGGVDSKVKSKASTFQNLLTLNGGGGGNPQYLRCYQDVYCEADRVGVNARWALANWSHESNASDYEYPGSTSYADFGVKCCGVPLKDFQHQFGFFLNLTHDPCKLGSGGTKEEYYCCWANDYLYGNKSTKCTDGTRSYLNSLMSYYYWVTTEVDPGNFEGRLNGLPQRIKTTGKSVSCGATNPVEVYKSGGSTPTPTPTPPDNGEDICCALKISNKDDLVGDFENNVSGSCSDIWENGKYIYGGKLEYSVEMPSKTTRTSCEHWFEGVCCRDSGELQWVPSEVCSNKETKYSTYNACKTATETFDKCCALKITGKDNFQGSFSENVSQSCDRIWRRGTDAFGGEVEYSFEIPEATTKATCEKAWKGVCCKDEGEYDWILSRDCKNSSEVFNTYDKCVSAQSPLREYTVSLKQGHNFLSWIGSDLENPLKASDILSRKPIILIGEFNDGVWNKLLYKENGQVKGSDFTLEAGKAYLLTSNTDFEIEYMGRAFSQFSWENMKGWQLVPAGALNPYSNTRSAVLSFEEANISQVALWDHSVGGFDYYVYSTSGNQYGESVRFNQSQGVFVRID